MNVPGDTVTAVVTKVDPVDQKISLSIRAMSDREQRDALKKMAAQQSRRRQTDVDSRRYPQGEARSSWNPVARTSE